MERLTPNATEAAQKQDKLVKDLTEVGAHLMRENIQLKQDNAKLVEAIEKSIELQRRQSRQRESCTILIDILAAVREGNI